MADDDVRPAGRITGDQVRAAVEAAGITTIDHHDCGLCGAMVYYSVDGGRLYFNPGCDCRWTPREPRSWDDAADWINMQSQEPARAEVARRFGIRMWA
jgi:hypothetical protein